MFPIETENEYVQTENSIITPKAVTGLGKSLRFDYTNLEFIMENGNPADNTDDKEKVCQWFELALRTVRKKYRCYIESFGVNTDEIIGIKKVSQGFVNSELQREITETARFCPIVSNVGGFVFSRKADRLTVCFNAELNNGYTTEVSVIV